MAGRHSQRRVNKASIACRPAYRAEGRAALAPAALAALCFCLPHLASAAPHRNLRTHAAAVQSAGRAGAGPEARAQQTAARRGRGQGGARRPGVTPDGAPAAPARGLSASRRAKADAGLKEANQMAPASSVTPPVAAPPPDVAAPPAALPVQVAPAAAPGTAAPTGGEPAPSDEFAGAEGMGAQEPNGPAASGFTHAGVLSSARWGGRGIARTASAYPLTKGAFTLTVAAQYEHARNLFVDGDTNSQSGQSVHVAYSPLQGMELALSYAYLTDRYTGTVPRNLQMQGDPSLRIKYGHHVAGPLALGILGQARLPTVDGNAKQLFSATSFRLVGLLSLQPIERLEILGNLGWDFDRSRHVFPGEVPDAVQRFVFGINDSMSGFWGAGVTGRISLGRRIDLLPFGEIAGNIGATSRATSKNNPVRATLGLRGYATRSRTVELAAGCDLRVAGAPRPNSPFGGLPRWQAFGQITVHLGEDTAKPHVCAPSAAVPTPIVAQPFRVRGHAVDAETGQPIVGAAVHVAGDEAALLFGVDEQTGQFVSAPQPAGVAPLHLVARAPGYLATEMDVPRSVDGRDVEVTLHLKAEARGHKRALLKGGVRDAQSGENLPGAEVELPTLKRVLHCNRKGHFGAMLPPGRYGAVVRAKGYEAQRKLLHLETGESLLLNVELEPEATTAP